MKSEKVKKSIKMAKNFISLFHWLFHPNLVPKPPIYLNFPLQIAEITVDHSMNGLCRTGNFHLFQIFMDQNLLVVG